MQEVSIIPRGMAGGYTMQRPENDNSYRTYNYLMDEICVCMGGRLAEELIFKDISTGASNDISQATKIAHNMVYNWGMSKNLGFLSLESSDQVFIGRDYQTKNDFSEKLASEADDEVRAILDYNYKRAKKLLSDNVDLLNEMAKLLLERETINKDEVDMLAEGKSADEIAKIMEERDRAQREKEEKFRKEQAELQRRAMYEKKLEEGERLFKSGVITEEELNTIKKAYQESLSDKTENGENNVNIVISQGKSLEVEQADLQDAQNQENTTDGIEKSENDNKVSENDKKDNDDKGE